MTEEQILEINEKYEHEFNEFHKIPKSRRLSEIHDLNGILIALSVSKRKRDNIIANAEHDQAWLNIDLKDLKDATEEQIADIIRSGICIDEEGLYVYV